MLDTRPLQVKTLANLGDFLLVYSDRQRLCDGAIGSIDAGLKTFFLKTMFTLMQLRSQIVKLRAAENIVWVRGGQLQKVKYDQQTQWQPLI